MSLSQSENLNAGPLSKQNIYQYWDTPFKNIFYIIKKISLQQHLEKDPDLSDPFPMYLNLELHQ